MSLDEDSHMAEKPVIAQPDSTAYETARFLSYLSVSPNEQALYEDARDGLYGLYAELELWLTLYESDAKGDERVEFQRSFVDLVHVFHTALPHDEAERRWLYDNYWEVMPEAGEVRDIETEVMSGGIRRVVHGRELVRRWIAWRQGSDEYAGHNGIGVARSALAGVITLLTPERPLPQEYIELVRNQDAEANAQAG
jgi:hypothetical protein